MILDRDGVVQKGVTTAACLQDAASGADGSVGAPRMSADSVRPTLANTFTDRERGCSPHRPPMLTHEEPPIPPDREPPGRVAEAERCLVPDPPLSPEHERRGGTGGRRKRSFLPRRIGSRLRPGTEAGRSMARRRLQTLDRREPAHRLRTADRSITPDRDPARKAVPRNRSLARTEHRPEEPRPCARRRVSRLGPRSGGANRPLKLSRTSATLTRSQAACVERSSEAIAFRMSG